MGAVQLVSERERQYLLDQCEQIAARDPVSCGCIWCLGIPRLIAAYDAERARRAEAEALLSQVFQEFWPVCRGFSMWDTVEHFLEHGLDQ